jgi:hypothetical protein
MLLTSAALFCSAASATLIWQQSEPDYTYVTAAISRHGAGFSPTFVSAADFALKPTFLQTYNVSSQSGGAIWEFTDGVNGGGLIVATARHTEAQGVGGVDIAAALTPPNGAPLVCAVMGFASLSSTGATPTWTWNKTSCSVWSVSFSDDGSTVVVTGGIDVKQPKLAPFITAMNGQTGATNWFSGGDDASQYGGSAVVTETGAFIAYSRGDDTVVVLDGKTGMARGLALNMAWNSPAQLSDTGDYLAWAGMDTANMCVWKIDSPFHYPPPPSLPSPSTTPLFYPPPSLPPCLPPSIVAISGIPPRKSTPR